MDLPVLRYQTMAFFLKKSQQAVTEKSAGKSELKFAMCK
jgi:hypothetical protein